MTIRDDGRWLLTRNFDGKVYLWDVKERKRCGAIIRQAPTFLRFSPDGHWVILASPAEKSSGKYELQVYKRDCFQPLADPLWVIEEGSIRWTSARTGVGWQH